jgi:ribosomal peptide maturation radical SAM protein 1
MSVCLATMPWQALDSPSLPIGLLRAAARRAGLPLPDAYHGSLRWAEFLLDRTDGEIGPAEYTEVADSGLFHEFGDWVFTGVLHDDPKFGLDAVRRYAHDKGIGTELIERMREPAADFIELAVAEILDRSPSIVGFTSTFMQNVPSLATAKRIKELAPEVTVVLGGGNCDGPMGAAIHRNYRFVDYVVRGEGEEAFPALLRALAGDGALVEVPGLCWWDQTGAQRCNEPGPPLPAGRIPIPDFDEWFDLLDTSVVNTYVEPRLVLETARGCWWGEKHHCTFCGLNGSLMQFRAKSADSVVAELTWLVQRHQVLDVAMVDNIIDNRYFTEVLPRIADLGWDLRIHYEVKANLKPTEIATLRAAGVTNVQPGIESLVTPVLKIMEKGVSAVQNVRTLRDCESAQLTTSWNWLYGFPGETPTKYEPVLRQLPALVHLQPPGNLTRIALERFSPYFDNPALGFARRTTSSAYRHVYDLDEADLRDMVYLFDTEPAGLTADDTEHLRKLVDEWTARYIDSSLWYVETGAAIVIRDRRVGWPASEYRIEEPHLRTAYRELEHGRSPEGLRRRVAEHGLDIPTEELRAWLADLGARGFVFHENDRWITLATRAEPVKVDRA